MANLLITGAKVVVLIACLSCASGIGGGDFTIPPFWVWGRSVVADLNGDGHADIAVVATYINGSIHTDGIQVFLGKAAGGFEAPVIYPVGPNPWGLCVADLDGDGRLDLIVSSPSSEAPKLNTPGDSGGLSILRQDPATPGRFLPYVWVRTGGVASAAATLDVNGDGRLDVVVGDGVTVNSRILLLNQGASPSGSLLPPVPLPVGTGHSFQDAVVADINGDGRPDLVLAAYDAVVLLCQQAGGGFATPILVPAGARIAGVGVADLDGDGRMDIVAVNGSDATAGGSGRSSVTVLLQNQPGSFTTSSVQVPDGASSLALGDLNGDGYPDIAVLSSGTPSRISILLQTAAQRGSFAVASVLPGPDLAEFIALGDLNSDGRTDLAVSSGPTVWYQTATPGDFGPAMALR